jgi:hypothetical protein
MAKKVLLHHGEKCVLEKDLGDLEPPPWKAKWPSSRSRFSEALGFLGNSVNPTPSRRNS